MTKKTLFSSALALIFGLSMPFFYVNAATLVQNGHYTTPEKITQSGKAYVGEIALKAAGEPCLVWSDYMASTSTYDIFFACWNGSNWVGLENQNGPDNISNNAEDSLYPQMVVGGINDEPYIAWVEPAPLHPPIRARTRAPVQGSGSGNYKINLVTWNGSDWAGLKNSNRPDNVTRGVGLKPYHLDRDVFDIALQPQTFRPAVVWEKKNPANIYYREWNGSDWVGKTGSFDNISRDGNALRGEQPVIAYGTTGLPHVAWTSIHLNIPNRTDVCLSYWDGQMWKGYQDTHYDKITSEDSSGANPSLTLPFDKPVLAWVGRQGSQYGIFVREWTGNAYRGLSGTTQDLISPNLYDELNPVISKDVSGSIGIVFQGTDSANYDHNIYYTFWDGNTWRGKLGGNFDKISNSTNGEAIYPSMKIDNLHRPLFTWQEDYYNPSDVFFSRWSQQF